MTRSSLRNWLPDRHSLRTRYRLGILGRHLTAPPLWHLNRASVASGTAIGVFFAFIPLPLQMLMAAVTAVIARANLPVSVAATWISNPFTMAPILFFQYQIGLSFLDRPVRDWAFEPSLAWLWREVDHFWLPLLVGGVACGLVAAPAAYGLVQLAWRLVVRLRWQRRRARRTRH
ncbi:MAG: DUF2062 domain-containing protein [Ectothiorhodospiraceae bacterium]